MEHSGTYQDNEVKNSVEHAIDLDLETGSYTKAGSDGGPWFKVTLDQVHCVEQVIWYNGRGASFHTWTCSKIDCSSCEGKYCSTHSITVYTEGVTLVKLPSVSDCRYGNRVKLERQGSNPFAVKEIAITEKGEEILAHLSCYA